jgi:hypothetical protein
VEGFAFKTAQVSPGEADVQAKYKLTILNDWPQLTVICLSEAKTLAAFLGMVPAQATIASSLILFPAASNVCKVPHKAKEVLVEPVLLIIPNINVLVPPHWHRSLVGGGSVALNNSRSFDVQELAGGKVCANTDDAKNNASMQPIDAKKAGCRRIVLRKGNKMFFSKSFAVVALWLFKAGFVVRINVLVIIKMLRSIVAYYIESQ